MIVRKLRLERGWSQEQLAEASGLSVRTIQRIERGQAPGLESLKALAAVFEVDVSDLQAEPENMTKTSITSDEETAIKQVREIKAFYNHLITYLVWMAILSVFNLVFTPEYFWVVWAAFGWGIGVVVHGVSAFEFFNLFGPEWEQRQIEKRLRKNR